MKETAVVVIPCTTQRKSPALIRNGQAENFVTSLFKYCPKDKGLTACLRRANNPSTEYQSWGILLRFQVNIEQEYQRLPYALIAAAIAKIADEKHTENGQLFLGEALRKSVIDKTSQQHQMLENGHPVSPRLRRLLACDDIQEACYVLRPILQFIQDRLGHSVQTGIDYAQLLWELERFNWDPHSIKRGWAKQFYSIHLAFEQEE